MIVCQQTQPDEEHTVEAHVSLRRELYRQALARGDLKTALAALDSEAKLLGLFDVEIVRRVEELERMIGGLDERESVRASD